MYLGKTLFAQVMDFLPWKTFHRIVNRYGGDHRARSLSCASIAMVRAACRSGRASAPRASRNRLICGPNQPSACAIGRRLSSRGRRSTQLAPPRMYRQGILLNNATGRLDEEAPRRSVSWPAGHPTAVAYGIQNRPHAASAAWREILRVSTRSRHWAYCSLRCTQRWELLCLIVFIGASSCFLMLHATRSLGRAL